MVEQPLLGADHVAHGDYRKRQCPRLAGRGIDVLRTGRPHAAAEHVGADNEIPVRVEHQAAADHRFPPARLVGDRMGVGDILVAGQRVADQDGVRAIRVEFAVGLIRDRKRAEIDPAVEPQRLVHKQTMAGPLLVRS